MANSLTFNKLQTSCPEIFKTGILVFSIIGVKLIKRPTTFLGTAAFATAVVGAIALGVWFLHALLERFLSTPHTVAGVTISPYGHRMDDLLTHHFDSIRVSFDGQDIKVSNPNLEITLLGQPKGVNLQMDSAIAVIQLPKESSPKKKPGEIPQFPEKLKFPIPVQVNIKEAQVSLSDGKSWQASDISVESRGEKTVALKANNISGDFISSPAKLDLDADFSSDMLKISGIVKTQKDFVALSAEAPKNNLGRIKTKTDVTIDNPEDWIPVELPKAVPELGKVKVSANASFDLQKKRTNYEANIKTRIGAFWPLLAENVTIDLSGDLDNIEADVLLQNDEGGSIQLNGSLDKEKNAFFSGRVRHMSAKFGPQMMPLDMEIKSGELYDNELTVSVETRQGSQIDAIVNFKDSLSLTFTGDISPYEPWALDWTQGNLTLGARSKAFGSFDGHSLKILAKINSIINAYHITADSLQVMLAINKKGIDFSNGVIYTPQETFDFDGDVKWNDPHPHTSWNVRQQHGGQASAYVHIGDTIALDVEADKVIFETIPFSDIKLGRNIRGKVSGEWHHDFDNRIGKLDLSVDGGLDAFNVSLETSIRENEDTLFVDNFKAIHNRNSVTASTVFILPNDSNPNFRPTTFLPVQVLFANISSHEFSIPLLLEGFNDSTLTSGMLNGDLTYSQGNKLIGNLSFAEINFRKIPPDLFNIRKLNIFAENDKIELNSYLDIGGGGWTGNTQVIIDNVFSDKRHVSFSHGSDNGGTLWAEGFIDNDFIFKGTVDANGSWFIPGTVSEIKNTDLHIDISAELRKGLTGITADLRLDSTIYEPPKTKVQFPIYMRGHVENGLLNIYEARTRNENDEVISGTLQFNLDSMRLDSINVHSDRYSIKTASHYLVLEDISSTMTDNEDELLITANIPKISYKFNNVIYGEAEAIARGNVGFIIPHSQEGIIKNSTITGDISIDKMVFYRDLDIDVTPTALDKYLTMFNNFVAKLRKSGAQEEKISVSSPINLSMHISDSQKDSIAVVTPFATLPLTVDIWVLGNTVRPLLRGDITNTNTGFIGVKDIYEFELNSFMISWNVVPWQKGVVDVSSSQELPYCSETSETEKETCPINLDLQGTISNLQAIPSSNCGNESSTASIYYNILLGCIANDNGEETDWNKLAGKAIGKVISTTANKTLGGDYIGDIDMKVMFFESNTTSDKDSSYFKIPVSLDRWVKNLSLIFGYTQDQSDNPTYDQSLQFGVNYTLPVFQEDEYSHENHLSPTLYLNGMLNSKQYLTSTGAGSNDRLEKNIGINYVYRFWNPCLLGIGRCEAIESPSKQKEDPK
ncbi:MULTISPECIES: hypothetical protein [unclassified Fibrobacter]|uniref:hypothetical protein n=1 Tax=unclassified Fibrobacter TaxID=2634177 RepID=UPI001183B630|nr:MULTISPECIES: hypothetical protein [unclassified Fibrobacter]